MLLAWLKLRRRNLGPILDANGWAINGRARINVAFGAAMTELAKLPQGSQRSLDDPFADKRTAVEALRVPGRPRRARGHLVRRQARRVPAGAGRAARRVLGEHAPAYKKQQAAAARRGARARRSAGARGEVISSASAPTRNTGNRRPHGGTPCLRARHVSRRPSCNVQRRRDQARGSRCRYRVHSATSRLAADACMNLATSPPGSAVPDLAVE